MDEIFIKRGRGRPKGVKNHTKVTPLPITDKPIKTIAKIGNSAFEQYFDVTINNFVPFSEYPTIEHGKNDLLLLDTDKTLFLIASNSKFYQELKIRSLQ